MFTEEWNIEEAKRIADNVIVDIRSSYCDEYGEEVVRVLDEVYKL